MAVAVARLGAHHKATAVAPRMMDTDTFAVVERGNRAAYPVDHVEETAQKLGMQTVVCGSFQRLEADNDSWLRPPFLLPGLSVALDGS